MVRGIIIIRRIINNDDDECNNNDDDDDDDNNNDEDDDKTTLSLLHYLPSANVIQPTQTTKQQRHGIGHRHGGCWNG